MNVYHRSSFIFLFLSLSILLFGCAGSTNQSTSNAQDVDQNSDQCSFAEGTCHLLDVQSPQEGQVVGTDFLVSGTCEEGFDIIVESPQLVLNPGEIECTSDGGIFGGTFSETLSFLPSSDGDQTLSFSIRDTSGVMIPVGSVHVIVDQTAPNVPTISNPINGSTFNTLSPTVTGTCQGDLVNVSGDNLVTSPVIGACLFGFYNVTVTFPAGTQGSQTISVTGTDSFGNESAAVSVTFTIDTNASSVTVEQGTTQIDPTHSIPVLFDVVFDETIVSGTFTITDILQSGTATGITWQITNTGNDKKFKLKAIAITSEGTLIPSVIGGAVQDAAGNQNASSTSVDNIVTYDTTVPTVTVEQSVAQADPANSLPVEFSVVFSEPIDTATFTTDDIVQSGTATLVVWSIVNSGDNQNFTLQAVSVDNGGTVIPSIAAGLILDSAGNSNTASTSTDNSVELDADPVTVTIDQPIGQADPTNALPIEFSVAFGEPIDASTFTVDDITQEGSAVGVTWELSNVGDDQHFTLQATAVAGEGTLVPTIQAGVVLNNVGNVNELSISIDNVVAYDNAGPSTPNCISTSGDATPSQSDTITWTGSTDTGSSIDHYEISIGIATPADTIGWTDVGTSATPHQFTSVVPHLLFKTHYTTYIRAVDSAGNFSLNALCPVWYLQSGYGVFQGVETTASDNSTILNQVDSHALQYSSHTFNDQYFEHGMGTHQIKIKEPGNYLLSNIVPVARLDGVTGSHVASVKTIVKVNGSPISTGFSANSFTRGPTGISNSPTQSSNHMTVLLENLSVNDAITIESSNNASELEPLIVASGKNFSTTLEFIPEESSIFSAESTSLAGGETNFNPTTPTQIVWQENIEDEGYSYDADAVPADITLQDGGDYLVSVNVPLSGDVTNGKTTVSIYIDGSSTNHGSYMVDSSSFISNEDSHTVSSANYTNIIHGVDSNATLRVEVQQSGNDGILTVPIGKKASIFIQKLDTSSNHYIATSPSLTDWNFTSPTGLPWTIDHVQDESLFIHDIADASNITVGADGMYMLYFSDFNTSADTYINPIVNVLINGDPSVVGVCSAHHQLDTPISMQNASCNLQIMMQLNAGDVVSLTTQQDETTGIMSGNPARLSVQKLD